MTNRRITDERRAEMRRWLQYYPGYHFYLENKDGLALFADSDDDRKRIAELEAALRRIEDDSSYGECAEQASRARQAKGLPAMTDILEQARKIVAQRCCCLFESKDVCMKELGGCNCEEVAAAILALAQTPDAGRITELEVEIAQLREVLKPFAAMATFYAGDPDPTGMALVNANTILTRDDVARLGALACTEQREQGE